MPELPEVETIRKYLEECLPGRVIRSVTVLLPRLLKNTSPAAFIQALSGSTITSVSRRGKYLFIHTAGSQGLLIHLRMTGRLVYEAEPQEQVPSFGRIIFELDEGRLIYGDVRTLGCLWLVPAMGGTGISGYDTLGPDGISPDFTIAYLQRQLKQCHRPIKSFLLDQTQVAGLGNIYVDEALFLAGISPHRCCDTLGAVRVKRLHTAIRQVLAAGLEHGGTTVRNFIDGSGREGQNQDYLHVYGREGTPCPHCGTIIVYDKMAGRGTHYCPKCQK
jgi:formamidopyrimidine-DNA glycosylase